MRRLLLILAVLLVVTVIGAPLALVWSALYTEAGAQFVVRHLPHSLGSITLSIEGLSGTPAHGLHVARVEIDHRLVHLTFEDISAQVRLAPLLLQTIHATHASVGSSLISVKRRTQPPTPGPPSFLPRWLLIEVDDGALGSATLSVYTGYHLQATQLRAAAVLHHGYIRFYEVDGLLEGAQVQASGLLRASDPLGMEVRGHLDWRPEGQPAWTFDGSAHGDLDALNITAHLVSPARAEVRGQALTLTSAWHLVGHAALQELDLHSFGLNTPLGLISGHIAGTLNEHGFEVHGALDPAGLRAGAFDVALDGSYANRVLSARQAQVRHQASGARASATGTLSVVPHGPQLELKGEWSDFRWPLVGRDIAARSAAGTFTMSGTLPYRLHLAGRGSAANLPVMPMELNATLDKDSFSFDPAEVDLFGGHASLSGRVAWSPADVWSVSGRVSNINPAALRPNLPGSLSFNIAASGRGFDARGSMSASFTNLSGKVRGVATSGSGTVTHAARSWGFEAVRLSLGNASVALDGRIDERLNLRFALSTHDLSLLAADSHGELTTAGSILGTPADPAIVATAHGAHLAFQNLQLEALDADINFDPENTTQESKVKIQLRHLSYLNRTVDSVLFTLGGLPSAYDAHLTASAPGLAGSAEAIGNYTQGVFHGQVHALSISGTEQLRLSLERPVDLLVSLAHVRLDWLCMVGTPGSMCADGEWTPASWSSTVMANELPLNTLTAGMTPAVEYVGTISALGHVTGGNVPLQGSLRAQLANAEIDHRLASKRIEHTRIGSGTVTVVAAPALVTTRIVIGDLKAGTIRGRLEIQRSTARWQDMPLSGELHAQTDEVGLVTLYVPDIDRAVGHLDTDIQVSGTVGAPRLAGVLKLSAGELDVYQVNLALRQLNLQAKLSEAGIDFSGGAKAGGGEVAANGHLEWRNLLPYGKFHLQGSNLRVADVPEARIDASPDLNFDINGRRIEVTGKVLLPYAKIQPKDITNAVRVSPDEVIVGQEQDNPEERFQVVSTITLALGDKVNLDAMGLTARLTGSVTIRSGYDAITRGTGELSVAEGKYTAYARQLDITRGRLLFTGGPIDDPGIDVRAQKQFPDVTAGINVRGTLLQPRISFFSDPPLPQSQIMSLILAGGSLQSAQNTGNAALGQGAALLAAELGPRVGLPDVSLETDPIANETSLVLGRYLSPRLYVSYGVSLTEQLNVFKMRYTLGDHWTIRMEMGTARGADLVYSIEK